MKVGIERKDTIVLTLSKAEAVYLFALVGQTSGVRNYEKFKGVVKTNYYKGVTSLRKRYNYLNDLGEEKIKAIHDGLYSNFIKSLESTYFRGD